ncbi:MAG: hypothetical protein OCD76_16840 [Reichenbachiella sp.]
MNKFVGITLVLLVLMVGESLAQTSRDSESSNASASSQFSSKKKASKKFYKQKDDQALVEYEALMKANRKKYKKQAKGMEKPQYSDPSYFGHKKPPKKRDVGKRKMCKECGIVH